VKYVTIIFALSSTCTLERNCCVDSVK